MEDKRRLTDEELDAEIAELRARIAERKRRNRLGNLDEILKQIEELKDEMPSNQEDMEATAVVSKYLSPIGGLNNKIDFVHDQPDPNAPEEVKAAWEVLRKGVMIGHKITELREKYGIPNYTYE